MTTMNKPVAVSIKDQVASATSWGSKSQDHQD